MYSGDGSPLCYGYERMVGLHGVTDSRGGGGRSLTGHSLGACGVHAIDDPQLLMREETTIGESVHTIRGAQTLQRWLKDTTTARTGISVLRIADGYGGAALGMTGSCVIPSHAFMPSFMPTRAHTAPRRTLHSTLQYVYNLLLLTDQRSGTFTVAQDPLQPSFIGGTGNQNSDHLGHVFLVSG